MPEAIDLSFAFGQPPEAAVAYLKGKGMALSWDWWETWQEAHSKAFTVAKVTRLDLLNDIRTAVEKTLTEGTTYEQFRREIEPKLKTAGWWGKQKVMGPHGEEEVQLGSPWRMRTIFRTNLQSALAAGRWQALAANADKRPYIQFVCVLDAHTRPTHRILHLKVFHINDPIWKKLAPPLGWGCRCRLRALTLDEVHERGLKVESSEGLLSTEDRLVSEKTGEMKPVTVYTDPKTGKRVSNEVGWDYNPGLKEFTPDLSKKPVDLVQAMQKEVRAEALAKRFPVKTPADLEQLLKAFDTENPGHFQMGFKSVKVERTEQFLMAASQTGDVFLSSVTQGGMNAKTDLLKGIGKIGKGQELEPHEEYAIEALWHEIGHARSKGWPAKGFKEPPYATQVMETLNQWVARHTYPEFMKLLGGEAKYQPQILAEGLGYARQIRNFRAVLQHLAIDEQVALSALRENAIETKWELLSREMAKKLAALAEQPESRIEELRSVFGFLGAKEPEDFSRVLVKFLGEAR